MDSRILNSVTGRLSLRHPQAESLTKLAKTLEIAPSMLDKERDVGNILSALKGEFPTLEDFERDFPSLCFALATGVGKTRLMGAFISYLHLAYGVNNFFVLAPNLTIYDKLIKDFTPNTPKYVFKGISEFATQQPEIITGDNYDQRNITGGSLFGTVKINIFNISKINSEVRGGKEPRIKRMREVLGDSYFNYLSELPDLVLLMDESHRYRASAGVKAINELKPLFGLELTATPFVEAGSGKVTPFKNVIVDYPLARAMEDGFVKEPAAVTQRNFDAKQHTPEQIEQIKLEDGIRIHEATKVELTTYARENEVKLVKPFMLVIARDTTHASQLMSLIQSNAFYGGKYKDHVIQVDSSKSGAEEEEMIRRLLAVESVDEPTEIVIHVNMLKEGWDVTNLYTIVPLRAANARTLIEQSIGRGLRLPYGRRTGVSTVDRLNIIAHDKFQEIIDEANRGDSPIRMKQVILDAPNEDDQKVSVQAESTLNTRLGLSKPSEDAGRFSSQSQEAKPLFDTAAELSVAQATLDVIKEIEAQKQIVPNSAALLTPQVQQLILHKVTERMKPLQASLLDDEPVDLGSIIQKTTHEKINLTIDIPRINVMPKGETTSAFKPFKLDVRSFGGLKPVARDIYIKELRTHEVETLNADSGIREKRLEDYLVKMLIDFDDIDYDAHADLLYDLSSQVVDYFKAQGNSDDELHNVLDNNKDRIANEIHSQMHPHFDEGSVEYEVIVGRGVEPIKEPNFTATAQIHDFRLIPKELSKIKQMQFSGFSKCLFQRLKFDSDTERRFAIVLERDAQKWFKPAKGQFRISYKLGIDESEYIPDFVVEAENAIYMCETKAKNEIDSAEVQAKAQAASLWCKRASEYTKTVGGKPWVYLLIPHDDIADNKQLVYFEQYEVKRNK